MLPGLFVAVIVRQLVYAGKNNNYVYVHFILHW
jgi:hypothetical protein